MDETPVRVQNPQNGKRKCDIGQLWAVTRDERNWNPDARPASFFRYANTRSGRIAEELLADASAEFLQTDGYAGYNALFADEQSNMKIARAGCNAHARRKFVEAKEVSNSPLATRCLNRFKRLYKIEEEIRCQPAEVRQRIRQERSLPILMELRADLVASADKAQGKVKTAINYFLGSFDDFQRFIHDGRIEIDSNAVERSIRGVALTKKNSLFAGSHDAASTWGIYFTLIETAKMNGVDPRRYLNWVTGEIEAKRRDVNYAELMPWHCPDE